MDKSNIIILCPGKLKEPYLQQAQSSLLDEIMATGNANIEVIQTSEERAPDNISATRRKQIIDKEGFAILKRLERICSNNTDTLVVALAVDGISLATKVLTKKLVQHKNIVFVIGGSLGLSDIVLAKANIILSFSPMTFTHQLMRVILLDQLLCIYQGRRYKKYGKDSF